MVRPTQEPLAAQRMAARGAPIVPLEPPFNTELATRADRREEDVAARLFAHNFTVNASKTAAAIASEGAKLRRTPAERVRAVAWIARVTMRAIVASLNRARQRRTNVRACAGSPLFMR